MKTDWLKPLLGRPGPFATVYLDATRANEAGDREVENRWKGVRRALAQSGAPDALLDALEEVAVQPSGHGEHGRVLIADTDGVLVDRILRTPPATTVGVWGPVPAFLPAARSADETVDYMVTIVDRSGADIAWSAGGRAFTKTSVEGGHDVLNKVSAAPLSQKRAEHRAEDSWERNAEAVAAELDRLILEHRPEIVILTGDVRAMALLRAEVSKKANELIVEVPGGARAAGTRQETFAARVEETLDGFRDRRREEILTVYRQEQGRSAGAVTSLEDVVAVLGRGQVAELILSEEFATDQGLDDRCLWVGPDPLHIGERRSQIEDLGVSDGIEKLPVTIALVRAALGQDAGVTFAPPGAVELIDGVGANLRWSDDSTPSEAATTMSADRMRRRRES